MYKLQLMGAIGKIYKPLSKVLGVATAALLFSCHSAPVSVGELHQVDAVSFKLVVGNQNVQVIDVRTHSEYLKGHVPGAVNIDINDAGFNDRIRETVDKDYPVAVYCLTGKRSSVAAGIMVDMGYEVYELQDGIAGYQGPVDYGEN